MQRNLKNLENESIYIFRQAFRSIPNIALLWSLGKDSNVMLWLAFKAFLGRIPFPLVHVDTGKKFKEMYSFRDKYVKKWNLNLIKGSCPSIEKIDPSLPPAARSAALASTLTPTQRKGSSAFASCQAAWHPRASPSSR